MKGGETSPFLLARVDEGLQGELMFDMPKWRAVLCFATIEAWLPLPVPTNTLKQCTLALR
jgi:hypothetical protein